MPRKNNSKGLYVEKWKLRLDWALRAIILLSGIYQTFWGETGIGILTLITLAVITIPAFFSRNYIKRFPIEIEILFLLMILLQYIIGEARDAYTTIPYYDKFVHFLLPFMVGLIGFVVFYTMYEMGLLKTTTKVMVILVILISIGIGAIWEIFEYASDEIIYPRVPGWHHFQGNEQEDALHDTMNDLVMDSLGGIMGALLAVYFINRGNRDANKRLGAFVDEVATTIHAK